MKGHYLIESNVIPANAYMDVGGRAMQEQLPRQEPSNVLSLQGYRSFRNVGPLQSLCISTIPGGHPGQLLCSFLDDEVGSRYPIECSQGCNFFARTRKYRAENRSVYKIREALSTGLTRSSGKKYIHVSTLHIASILPAYFKQRVGNFT